VHLCDGDAVEGSETLLLGQPLADEDGVETFEIGENNQLLQWGVVADVALGVGVGVAPLFGGLAEEGDVEQVGLAGIDGGGLCLCHRWRDERLFDGGGVDAVVDLGERALEIPIELEAAVFVVLEAAEFFDQINFEFRADPHAELECDVGMGKGAAIATSRGFEANGIGFLDPFLDTDLVAIESGLAFNCGEFAIIKIRIEHRFPDAEELHGVPVAEPVRNEKLAVFRPQHVGEGDVITIISGDDRDRRPANVDRAGFILVHRKKLFRPASFLIPSNSRELKLVRGLGVGLALVTGGIHFFANHR